jgi:phosphoenolpyruvate carboxylase
MKTPENTSTQELERLARDLSKSSLTNTSTNFIRRAALTELALRKHSPGSPVTIEEMISTLEKAEKTAEKLKQAEKVIRTLRDTLFAATP